MPNQNPANAAPGPPHQRSADRVARLPADPVAEWPTGMPSPVLPEECAALRARTAAVARAEAVLLQGGGPAGLPVGRGAEALRSWMTTLQEMELPLAYATRLPVVKVGWTVGAGSGPPSRSAPAVYADAVIALNLIRALSAAAPEPWEIRLEAAGPGQAGAARRDLAAAIGRGLDLMAGYGLRQRDPAARREVFVGNDGVSAHWERAETGPDAPEAPRGPAYATSGHLQWLGTSADGRDDDVARLAGIANAVAVRIRPWTRPDTVLRLLDALDPHREPGRLTLVVGLGADRVRHLLPVLIEKVRAEGAAVCWLTDPLRTGVTPSTAFDEVRGFVEVHRALGSHPGGVQVEPIGPDRLAPEAARRLLLDLACAFAEAY
jgi:3-deoxy-7-phosphoheptulonate synthase